MTSIDPLPESRSKKKPVPTGAGPGWKPEDEEEDLADPGEKPKGEG